MVRVGEVWDVGWNSARGFLPFDLDGFAVESGALSRRRGVSGGEALVRSLLLVGLPNASLERSARASREAGLSQMKTTAYFKRLCSAEPMLKGLFFHLLSQVSETQGRWNGLRLLAVDATALCGPGAKGMDQRLHTVYDLAKGVPLSVDLTGPEGGEALWRHDSFGHGDLVLADAGYGYNRSFEWALKAGARILVRFHFATVTLFDESGRRVTPNEANAKVPAQGSFELRVETKDGSSPLRAVGSRNLKGEVVWLLTDLSLEELPTEEVYELYRKRWQVELYFKRLKSLLDLDELPSRDGPSVRAWIWAKLVLATLAVLLSHERFSPWGAPSRRALETLCTGTLEAHPSAANPRRQTPKRKTQRKETTKRTQPQTTLPLEA